MSTAHTPGPWILATVPTSVGSCHKIGPFPNGSRVATFACVYADGNRLGIDDDLPAAKELSANARLIAAAPDLLEALCIAKKFMEIASDWSVDEAEINGDMRSTYDWLEIVNSAIAKATGGQS